ncbi:MAG: hypothetical protein AAF558_00195, partial [Verrucomicrobiota bacterium]
LKKSKFRVPRDIGYVSLQTPLKNNRISGMRKDPSRICAMAVDLLFNLLYRNRLGRSSEAYSIQTEAVWVEGQSLKHQPPAS